MLATPASLALDVAAPTRALSLWTVMLWLGGGAALHAQSIPAPDPYLTARWESSDWVAVGVVAGATAERVRIAFQKNRSALADVLERVGWWYGTPLFTAPASLLTIGAGALLDDNDVRDTGILMGELLLSALLIQQPVRIIVGRARPFTGEGHLSFRPFTFADPHGSFISGHSWSAFGISNIVARQIDQPWVSVSLYSLATLTALSRLYADKHWLTDVILGSVAGYAISTALWNEKQDEMPSPGAALRIPPRRWLTISWSF
jgi:membrane-associated phospholipid phosphatase